MTLALVLSGATLALLVTLRSASPMLGLVDRPGDRKRHDGSIPVVGGIAVAGATLLAGLIHGLSAAEWTIMLGMLAHMVLGALDDRWPLPAAIRLVLHGGVEGCTAALLLSQLWVAPPGFAAMAILALGAMLVCNALNMLDGMDGLAGGVAFVALACVMTINPSEHALPWLTACALVPFLFMNMGWLGPKVFLGDAGSMSLGHVVFWSLLPASPDMSGEGAWAPYLWPMALPVLDTVAVIGSRLLSGRSPLQADRLHIHHLLQDAGIGPRSSLAILLAAAVSLFGVGCLVLPSAYPYELAAWMGAFATCWFTRGWLHREAVRRGRVSQVKPTAFQNGEKS
jgi:UDP-GlcNAc:undecaprenyl-phosphate GlcNAc-1-phosphate transferase